ncbi:TfuA-like protein [Kitasatospora paracochleata]|uniref:TfuA-like core domain-containing protein n=1 Tax=Kitasatospora paracochleata TaxID=58354 RepID=A0ABT1IT07_9ACTN|nr:TfuA-like protein [Kitasatospora paracochleata]MCP2308247.1 hypothetical protein [Kitasatospora paracochleata]
MTKRYLFLGPSAPGLTPPPGITLLPPIAAGDLLALPLAEGDTVGIVDGYFHHVRAVPHKEILAVLDRGVAVLGAASMGALRAAELDTFGMHGIGRIYRDYRDGRIDADDEVTLLHGPAESDYRAMSEPLVVVRATLSRAVRDGACDEGTAERIVDALRALPYPRRSFRRFAELADTVGVGAGELRALGEHCARHREDVKRADTLALVERLAAAEAPAVTRCPVPRTVYLAAWEDRARRLPGDGGPGTLAALRLLQVLSDDLPAARRSVVLASIARECADSCGRPPTDDDAVMAVAHGVHCGVYPDPATGRENEFAFLRPWLTEQEASGGSLRDRLELFLSRSFELDPGVPADTLLLDAFEHTPLLARAHDAAASCLRTHEEPAQQRPEFDPVRLSREELAERLTARWGCLPAEADLHALDRGFESLDAAVEAARPYHRLLANGSAVRGTTPRTSDPEPDGNSHARP